MHTTRNLALLAMCLGLQLLLVNAVAPPPPVWGKKYGPKPQTQFPSQTFLSTELDPAVAQPWFENLIGTTAFSMISHEGIYFYLRGLHVCGFASYEAFAPFTPGLRGFLTAPASYTNRKQQSPTALSDVLRVPPSARTDENKKIAVIYAVYKSMVTLYPDSIGPFDAYMQGAGLPVDTHTMDNSPKGIGNKVAAVLINWFLNDGTNQLGNLPDITYNRIPFSDWNTHYSPVNSCEMNVDIGRWQPILSYSIGTGLKCQSTLPSWVNPPLITGKTYRAYSIPPPNDILGGPRADGFRNNVDRIIKASAALDDVMKCTAEVVDSPVVETGRKNIINLYKLNMDQQIMIFFAQMAITHDGDHLASYFKIKYDNARPYSVIRNRAGGILKGNITAWAGPYLGTRSIKPTEWRQYVRLTHAGPDAPSGAVSDFTAGAVFMKRALASPTNKNPSLNWTVICPQGWGQTEVGYAPTKDTTIVLDKAEDIITFAKNGREWSGIHFLVATTAGEALGRQYGEDLYNRFTTDFGWSCASIGLPGTGNGIRCF